MRHIILALILVVIDGCAPAGRTSDAAANEAEPAGPAFQGDLARFKITNDNPDALSPRAVSFGQIFRAGQVRRDTHLTARLGETAVPVQMDAKALHPDGSVRHAVITLAAPRLEARASLDGMIATDGARGPQSPSQPKSAPDLEVVLDLRTDAGSERMVRIDLPSLASSDVVQAPRPWLNGPLVQERRYKTALFDGIQLVFDVWTPASGPSRVDVIVRNDAAQNADIGMRAYDVRMILDGKTVFEAKNLKHYRYQTWRREILVDGLRPPRITPDTRLLIDTGATPHYGEFRPDPVHVAGLRKIALQEAAPLASVGNVTPYMPGTGGRADIGPLPSWAVFYLLDPSRQNRETLLANADVAGSIPWHVRDLRTDGPISIDAHPDVWLDYRGRATPEVLAHEYETEDGVWTIDDAHQPSLTYLPYLLTGSQYYRDELAMQAGYTLLSVNPEYRRGREGIVLGLQVRAVAWDLRTLANAAYILPADDPLQPYFQEKLRANLQEIINRYVEGDEVQQAGELRGYLPGPYAVEGSTPPWQQDYLVMVLGWIDGMGFPQARPILAWMTNFIAGRFTNADRGYDPIYGTPYYLFVADPKSQQLLNSWSGAFQATFDPAKEPVTTLDWPGWAGGYAAVARASLASIINATGSAQAREAYAFVKAKTPDMEASYSTEPAFAITPRTSAPSRP